ncbi:hypothetical protein DMB42_43450 [Nonomuraea sp. WAC 01424]|uniref:hypothetical protein n=1 Tax=Nonomuraea sp. WAC 01424 TaxID=2203200 RepID=UPI000F7A4AFD|nr:hypothetical protein [Nonomuraea sp. WAC 01424]RSM98621.1 hypothetical protein DMB42_43450 [Nonomuraea sp. WAC 01424]
MTITHITVPGRWTEGAGLVLGPALLLAGVLVRSGADDFFPGQLAAYAADPGRMVLSYSLYAAGVVLLWPAVTALGRVIGDVHPALARWGVVLAMLGLFGRVFHAGVSHLAFQLVDALGPEEAQRVVTATYGAFHVFKAVNVCIMGGWIVLAVGAFRARAFGAGPLGVARCVALALAAGLPLGVLKGSSDPIALVALAGLAVAFVPMGVAALRTGPAPRWWALALTFALVPVAFFVGMAG